MAPVDRCVAVPGSMRWEAEGSNLEELAGVDRDLRPRVRGGAHDAPTVGESKEV